MRNIIKTHRQMRSETIANERANTDVTSYLKLLHISDIVSGRDEGGMIINRITGQE